MKKVFICLMVLIILVPSISTGQIARPGSIKQFSAELVEEENPFFVLRWKDEEETISLYNNEAYREDLYVQVNFYVRNEDSVIMREMNFKYIDLAREEGGFTRIDLDLLRLGIVEEPVNVMFSSYNFRVRIGLAQRDILGSYTLFGSYSPTVSSGKIYPYNYASPWALQELDKAYEYSLIPDCISSNMRDVITREEFAQVMVAYYESKTGQEIDPVGQYFADTDNQEVLKAAALGIITGYEDGTYRPDNPITRQDIAVVIGRTLQKVDPTLSLSYSPVAIENGISAYAYDSMMFLVHSGILKGDETNNLNPLEHTTREQAVLLTTRAYEYFQ